MDQLATSIDDFALTAVGGDPLWFKDAIVYELHVKAFFDANNDGIGDFRGLAEKLDYIQALGVTAIWLLPFYPSPMLDDGYDVSDYHNIHAAYGTRHDFRHFVREAHRRGLRHRPRSKARTPPSPPAQVVVPRPSAPPGAAGGSRTPEGRG